MIEIKITEEMLVRAKSKAKEMGRIRNSILRGKGNVAGFLGEEIVLKAFAHFKSNNTYDSDVSFRTVHFEIKTKQCTSEPISSYECSVANSNPNQKAEYYIFCRVLKPTFEKGWILGYLSKKEYFKNAVFLREGDYDASNDWHAKADCYNVPISKLKDPQILMQLNALKLPEKIIPVPQLTFQPCV